MVLGMLLCCYFWIFCLVVLDDPLYFLVLIHLLVCTSLLISLFSYDLPVISNWDLLSWSWRMMCCDDCWSHISPLFVVPFLVSAYCSDGMDPRLNWHIFNCGSYQWFVCCFFYLAVVYVQVSFQESYSFVGLVADVPYVIVPF